MRTMGERCKCYDCQEIKKATNLKKMNLACISCKEYQKMYHECMAKCKKQEKCASLQKIIEYHNKWENTEGKKYAKKNQC